MISDSVARALIAQYADGGVIQRFASTGSIDLLVREYVGELHINGPRQEREIFALNNYLEQQPDRGPVVDWSDLSWPDQRAIDRAVKRCWAQYHPH